METVRQRPHPVQLFPCVMKDGMKEDCQCIASILEPGLDEFALNLDLSSLVLSRMPLQPRIIKIEPQWNASGAFPTFV